jgi:hypothetical protein
MNQILIAGSGITPAIAIIAIVVLVFTGFLVQVRVDEP